MKDCICPIDNKPCEKDCPDRFYDSPCGCLLSMLCESLGGKVIVTGDQEVMICVPPDDLRKEG